MRKYHSDNKNYNAILDAMAEIRKNQLNEGYYAEAEHEEEEMEEGMHGDEEEVAESMHGDEEEVDEGHDGDHMDDEEAEAIAEMMDEALYEMDLEDDEDNLNEEDGDRKARRRNRLRQALLIGAGLAAAGLGGAAYATGRGARQPGADVITGNKSGLQGIIQDISRGSGMIARGTPGALAGLPGAAATRADYTMRDINAIRKNPGLLNPIRRNRAGGQYD